MESSSSVSVENPVIEPSKISKTVEKSITAHFQVNNSSNTAEISETEVNKGFITNGT